MWKGSSQDTGAVVDFLYSGEASVHQEDFDSFMTLAKDLQLNGLWGDFPNDDEILYSDEENETREKNQKSSSSPLKKCSQNVNLDKDLQLNDLAGQERDNLLNESDIANPKVENEMTEMNQKSTSSTVKKYSQKVKLGKGATTIPIPSQFHGRVFGSTRCESEVEDGEVQLNGPIGKNKDNSICLKSVQKRRSPIIN